jgi:O-antigen/teichoic acid export membrane protein
LPAIYAAFFPAFSNLIAANKVKELAFLYHKSSQLLSIMLFPAGIAVMLFSKDMLSLYIGNPVIVESTYILLSLLIAGNMLLSIMLLPLALQLGYGWTTLSLYKNIAAVIIYVPILLIMITRYGAIGAAIAWILLALGYVLIEVPIMHRRLLKEEKWKWYLMDVGCPLIISIFVIGIARWLIPTDGSSIVELIWLVIAIVLAMAISLSILRPHVNV